MKIRAFSFVLCVFLLTAILPFSASAATWTAGTKGEYLPVTTAESGSLIKGLVPTRDTGTSTWTLAGNSDIACLTDEQLINAQGTNRTMFWISDVPMGNRANFTFTMDKVYDVEQFIVGSELGADQRLTDVRIYAGTTLSTLFTDENLVVDVSGLTEISNAFRCTPRVAKFVGFSVLYPTTAKEWWQQIRFGELAVYGKPSESVTVAPTVEGAQVRTKGTDLPRGEGSADLRFVSTVNCNGVAADAAGKADYTNATVTTPDGTFPMTGAGTLLIPRDAVQRGDYVPKDVLTVEVASKNYGKNIPAEYLYSLGDKKITFTALVTGIPYTRYGAEIYARSYIAYSDNGETRYLYSDIVSRSLYAAWHSAAEEDDQLTCGERTDYLPKSTSGGYFPQGARVVFLGDSITYMGMYEQQIFRYYAATHTEDEVLFFATGILGGCVPAGLTYIDDEVMCYEADAVVINYGMNDIGRDGYTNGFDTASAATKARIDDYAANMERLILKFRERGVHVILCTPTPYEEKTTRSSTNANVGCAEALRRCSEKVRALAAKYGCTLVDYNARLTQANDYVQNVSLSYSVINNGDRVHPGVLGHDIMARVFLKAIGEERVSTYTDEQVLDLVENYGGSYGNICFEDLSMYDATRKYFEVVDYCLDKIDDNALEQYWRDEFIYLGVGRYNDTYLDKAAYLLEKQGAQIASDYGWRYFTVGSKTWAARCAAAGVYHVADTE